MSAPFIHQSFAAGEITPALFGQVSLAKFNVAATTLRNMWPSIRGGANSRAGTAYILPSKQTVTSGDQPRLIAYQYNVNQGYALELGDRYMRFYFQGAPVLENAFAINAASRAASCIVGAPGNNFVDNDWVFISGVNGMPQINNRFFLINGVTGGTFQLNSLFALAPINSTGYGTYVSGGTVARVYTLATPWSGFDVQKLKYAQSADVMSLVHPSYPPYDLARITANNWTLTPITFGSALSPPPSVTSVATTLAINLSTSPPTKPAGYSYVVTSVDINGNESIASQITSFGGGVDMAQTAGSNVVSWTSANNAVTYNIYRAPTSYNTGTGSNALAPPAGSIFSFVGSTYGLQFVDSNIVPDLSQVPPLHKNPFAPGQIVQIIMTNGGNGLYDADTQVVINTSTGLNFVGVPIINFSGATGPIEAVQILNAGIGFTPGDTVSFPDPGGAGAGATGTVVVGPATGTFPSVVGYYQQRRVYASSVNNPDTYWMSKPGEYLNFDTAIPVEPADAITGTPWAQQVNGIQFLVQEPGGLVAMTGGGAWQITGQGGSALNPQPISPSSQQAQPQIFSGCSPFVPPLTINSDILYNQAKGSAVRDMVYNYFTNNYVGSDQTVLSGHLFTGYTIHEWCFCEEPYKIIWAARSDGVLLSFTYLKEQEIYGWARHDTQGTFISVCSVAEVAEADRPESQAGLLEPLLSVDAPYFITERNLAGGPMYFIERMNDRFWLTAEDPWCVDCGLTYTQPTFTSTLTATSATGAAQITAHTSAPAFNSTAVGEIIRIGGGIFSVTGYIDPFNVTGAWNLPPVQIVPGTQNGVQFLNKLTWTFTRPVTSIAGLEHLAGFQVVGLADGVVVGPFTVDGDGAITLPFPASAITLGLSFTAQVQTPYLEVGQPTVQGRRKNVNATTARIEASQGVQAGSNQPDGSVQSPMQLAPPWTNMQPMPTQDTAPTYTSPGGQTVRQLFTGDVWAEVPSDWDTRGQVAFQQVNPLPMTILAVIPETLEGDTVEAGYSDKQQGGGNREPRPPGNWMLAA